MYAAIHGAWCNTRTFPMSCKYCGDGIFFFQCDCGSRVLFDDLGPPWPMHNCWDDSPSSALQPSDENYFKNMQGVTLSVQGEDDGLLHGTMRFTGSVDDAIVQSAKQSEPKTRDIMSVTPYSGGKREAPIGVVTHIGKVLLEKRFNLASNSLGAQQVIKILGSLMVTQITIHVDEIAIDPDAEDLLSYTFWCNPKQLPKSLSIGNVVSATIKPTDLMGVGTWWIVSKLEVLA